MKIEIAPKARKSRGRIQKTWNVDLSGRFLCIEGILPCKPGVHTPPKENNQQLKSSISTSAGNCDIVLAWNQGSRIVPKIAHPVSLNPWPGHLIEH